ncbi:hypothetical protein D9757_004031 [Collybiopsis confluens]|uniref:Uncharacterized protein n=1 Tax=Collybiopsis confluens TaxID=2823264 RepID=A0A8H5HX11_9AGAR|nr:hypothetical protein D9757_004031 [Collybiopsis confluens]
MTSACQESRPRVPSFSESATLAVQPLAAFIKEVITSPRVLDEFPLILALLAQVGGILQIP